VKRYRLTKVQRDLRDAMLRLAKKEGWKVETITIDMNSPRNRQIHKDVSDFIRTINAAEKRARKSKLKVGGKL